MPNETIDPPKITVEEMDYEYFISFDHHMTKDHYLSFAAYFKSDKVFFNRLYPEQSPVLRLPLLKGGKLYVFCIYHGLFVYKDNLKGEISNEKLSDKR